MVSYKKYSTIRFGIPLLEFTADRERKREGEHAHGKEKERNRAVDAIQYL